jgi:hypothetical protein
MLNLDQFNNMIKKDEATITITITNNVSKKYCPGHSWANT